MLMDSNKIDRPACARTSATGIEADGISRRNPKGDGWLIKEISVALAPGDRLGLVGPSGAGKTVLLRALALLDPLDSGTILWQGRPVCGDGVPRYRKQVIYLHQRPALFDFTVEDNVRLPFGLKAHRDRPFDRRRALDLLAALGRDAEFLTKPSRRLSGGEAQLVSLVRALQLEPTILLLDEPTASLDSTTSQAVERTLETWLAQESGRALVWVSHDLEQTERMTTRQIRLRGGCLDTEPHHA
jgi:putative ABC transport system ATP-binding protein